MSLVSPSANVSMMSSPNNNNFAYKFSPSMGIVIVVVVAALFFLIICSIYVRRCASGPAAAAELGEGNPAVAGVAMNTPLTSSASRTSKGLEKSVVESLPVVHFKDLKNLEMEKKNQQHHKKNKNKNFLSSDPLEALEMGLHDHGEEYSSDDDDDDDDGQQHRECTVCLSDFEEEDDLRLLPGCKHVFHKDCIDVWFQSHSTCPLCRASLVPKTSDGSKQVHDDHAGDQARPHEEAPHPSSTVRLVIEEEEEQESREEPAATGDLRRALEEQALAHQMVITIPGEDEEENTSAQEGAAGTTTTTTSPGSLQLQGSSSLAREDQRDSARLALFRNSRSFKIAARGVVAHERASSLSHPEIPLETGTTSSSSWKLAASPATTPNMKMEAMRRSSSLDNSDGSKLYIKDFFSSPHNPNSSPKLLQSQHSLPATMKLATINLPNSTAVPAAAAAATSKSSSNQASPRPRTGSYNFGFEKFVRTGSINRVSVENLLPHVTRSNSEHWVSVELDPVRTESSSLSSKTTILPVAVDKDQAARIMRKQGEGADQSPGSRDSNSSERWNFLNLRNLLSSRSKSSSSEHQLDITTSSNEQ
ncbi:unnamed protein product [Sphagnum jensenii]|uniref:RING-type E3 ubiquitin transferase n=1 Tax=Sphagnum jensenii TaxID=128206 RepID=A0ABP1AB88_9BRYO